MKSAIQLIQSGAKFQRFTSGDENNYFCGSYWELNGDTLRCDDRWNSDVASKVAQIVHDTENVSDGYHTFKELYNHRVGLFIALCNMMPDNCHKTLKNFEGEQWDGWFILQCDHPIAGQMSYHVPIKEWERCRVKVVDYNYNYDGHNSQDVLNRLSMI